MKCFMVQSNSYPDSTGSRWCRMPYAAHGEQLIHIFIKFSFKEMNKFAFSTSPDIKNFPRRDSITICMGRKKLGSNLKTEWWFNPKRKSVLLQRLKGKRFVWDISHNFSLFIHRSQLFPQLTVSRFFPYILLVFIFPFFPQLVTLVMNIVKNAKKENFCQLFESDTV